MSDATGTGRRAPMRIDQLTGCGAHSGPAITFKDETISYGELAHQVSSVAAGLHRLGVRRGDRVVTYLEKRLETVVAMFATAAAGAVFVPVNPVFKARQLAHIVADCTPRAIITSAERRSAVRATLPADGPVAHTVVIGGTGTSAAEEQQLIPWAWLRESPPDPVPDAEAVIDVDPAAIFYTSGSTGGPKGVVLSHRNLLAGAQSVATYLEHTADDVILGVLPLSFDAGFSQVTTSLVAGAHVVLANYLVPRDVVRLCARHQVTGLTCVPPLWLQLAAQHWPAGATAAMRYFANTGGRLPAPALARLRELFDPARPYLMYGLTEAFRSTFLDPAEVDRRPDSIGKAIPNAEVQVVRPDGSLCAPHENGEIVHRGSLVALGYWNDPDGTAERFRPAPGTGGALPPDIAVWSGDVAYRDDEGFLYFVGRADEMIKTSGYRVSPTEIEEAAYATGLVGEAVAFGVPDEQLGQHTVLAVTGAGGGACDGELVGKELSRELPPYMVPRRVASLPELPRSGNGKFDRVALRRMVAD